MGKRRPQIPLPLAGFVLNVDKPAGWTSHDAVQRIRSILRFRKVGHTGTLDPFATGVLLCCVGRATKLSNALMDLPKTYTGSIRWGLKTDTGDAAGQVLETSAVPCPGQEELAAAARTFHGEILQVPPMVSAIKHEGQPLYRLARQGLTVERQPRRVRVEEFVILGVADDRIRFRVVCSRGTYVRVLAEDLAGMLAGRAHVETLCRTRVGSFSQEDAIRIDEIDEEITREQLLARSIMMSDALSHLPAWRVPPFWAAKVHRGHTPPWVVLDINKPPAPHDCGRLVTTGGDLLALAEVHPTVGPVDRDWTDALEMKLIRVI